MRTAPRMRTEARARSAAGPMSRDRAGRCRLGHAVPTVGLRRPTAARNRGVALLDARRGAALRARCALTPRVRARAERRLAVALAVLARRLGLRAPAPQPR